MEIELDEAIKVQKEGKGNKKKKEMTVRQGKERGTEREKQNSKE